VARWRHGYHRSHHHRASRPAAEHPRRGRPAAAHAQARRAVTGANGVAYLALAGPLDDLLGIPGGFLRATGVFLVACAGILLAIAVSAEPRRGAIFAAIPVNVAWALASVAMLVAGWHDPTTAGAVWIGLQAGTVALFAALQTAGARC